MATEDATHLLLDVELFDRFDTDDHQRLADAAEQLDLVRNDVVFEEGAEADACFVMVSGTYGHLQQERRRPRVDGRDHAPG